MPKSKRMDGPEAVDVFDLVVRENLLPEQIDEAMVLCFIGNTAVNYYDKLVKQMADMDIADEQKQKTLRDGQAAGKMLLRVEAHIGSLYTAAPTGVAGAAAVPKAKRTKGKGKGIRGSERANINNVSTLTKTGVLAQTAAKTGKSKSAVKQHLNRAARIAAHPEIMQEVIEQAEANDDIPTLTAADNKIQLEKERKLRKKAEAQVKKVKEAYRAEELEYILTLDRCRKILPKEPPKKWGDKALKEATKKALILIHRLRYFNEPENPLLKGG